MGEGTQRESQEGHGEGKPEGQRGILKASRFSLLSHIGRGLQNGLKTGRTCLCFLYLCAHHFRAYLLGNWARARGHENGQDYHPSQQQLEGGASVTSPSVVSSDKNVCGRIGRVGDREIVSKEKKPSWTSADTYSTSRRGIMPPSILPADQFIYFAFAFRGRAPLRGHIMRFYVQSNITLDTYVVDGTGLQNFLAGLDFSTHGGFHNLTEHRQAVRIPYEGLWHLIISN